jgi:hypothetical protein
VCRWCVCVYIRICAFVWVCMICGFEYALMESGACVGGCVGVGGWANMIRRVLSVESREQQPKQGHSSYTNNPHTPTPNKHQHHPTQQQAPRSASPNPPSVVPAPSSSTASPIAWVREVYHYTYTCTRMCRRTRTCDTIKLLDTYVCVCVHLSTTLTTKPG